jgi:predicted lipoprotein with Yx(FWY)xxD motif
MTNRAFAYVVAALIAVPLIAGCGSSKSKSSASTSTGATSTRATTTSTTASSDAGSPETIKAKRSSLGTILADGEGKTVYLFEKDKGTTSTCSGACASAWPPVTTDGAPKAGGGVQTAMLTTSKRSDGTTQVVYGGHPLYYFVRDADSGDAYGQGIDGFGAEWYVLGPNGKKVEGGGHKSGEAKTTTTSSSSGSSGGGGY